MAQKLLDVGITEEFLKDGISKQLNIEPNQVFVTKYTSSKIEGTGGIVGEAIFVDVEAKINDKTETCHFVAKHQSSLDYQAGFAKAINAFYREGIVYSDFIPAWNKTLLKNGLQSLKAPTCYNVDKNNDIILLENLVTSGFKTVSFEPDHMTMLEIEMVLKELANFHAVSFDFIRKYGEEKFKSDFDGTFHLDGIYGNNEDKRDMCNIELMSRFSSACIQIYKNSHKDLDPGLVKVLDEYSSNAYDRCRLVSSPPKGGFNVLVHNDLNRGNLMTRYEGNVLKDLKIIDLQLLRLSRPTLDLANFYANSTMPKFRQKHEKEWNDLFYQELSSTLTKLGYDPGAVYPKARFLQDLVDFDVWLLHYSFTRCLFDHGGAIAFAPAKSLEDALGNWDQMFKMGVDKPSDNLVAKITEIVEDMIQKGFFKY